MATLEDVEALLEEIDGKLDTLTSKVDEDKNLYKPCPNCNATGVLPPENAGCGRCAGTGFIKVRIISKEEK